jgi:hypothetical protein
MFFGFAATLLDRELNWSESKRWAEVIAQRVAGAEERPAVLRGFEVLALRNLQGVSLYSLSSALASFRSLVSNPSVNHP